MKKLLTAAAAGLALIASQAAASSDAVLRAGDRIGSVSDTGSQLEGTDPTLLIIGLTAAAALIAIIYYGSKDGDSPHSP